MYTMAIAVLCAVPAFYLARAKGYWGAAFATGTMVLALIAAIATAVPGLGLLVALPLAGPLLVWLLPARKGAPGRAYLRIRFACPECGAPVEVSRQREGDAILCPSCGEIVTVPRDAYSPQPGPVHRERPAGAHGLVCFARFGNLAAAHTLSARLNELGVPATVFEGDGGTMPYLANTEGHRVMIDAEDWDEAVRIEQAG